MNHLHSSTPSQICEPEKTLPKAMFIAVGMITLNYVLPLLIALPVVPDPNGTTQPPCLRPPTLSLVPSIPYPNFLSFFPSIPCPNFSFFLINCRRTLRTLRNLSQFPFLFSLPRMQIADWTDGTWVAVGNRIAGPWLSHWIALMAMVSALGMFSALLCTTSRLIYGVASSGQLPKALTR